MKQHPNKYRKVSSCASCLRFKAVHTMSIGHSVCIRVALVHSFTSFTKIKSIKMNHGNYKKWTTFWWPERIERANDRVCLFVASVLHLFGICCHSSLMHCVCLCLCLWLCIDCCSWCGLKQRTRWWLRLWMQVVRVVYHTVHSGTKKGATKGNGQQKHWYRDNGHNSFWSCRKIKKTLYFLISLSASSRPQFSLLLGISTFMKNWFSIPSNLRK